MVVRDIPPELDIEPDMPEQAERRVTSTGRPPRDDPAALIPLSTQDVPN